MSAVPALLVDDRQAWLEARRGYLGGTDVAALVSRNKYASPMSVYSDKVLGHVERSDEDMKAAMAGLALEPIVKASAERDCAWVLKPSKTYFHPEYPFLAVNPDAELGDDALVEIKTHGFRTAGEWGEENTDQIPDAYHVQCIWQLGITGRDYCFVVACDRGTLDNRYYRVEADPEYFGALVKIAVAFWNEHILTKTPPNATGHDADEDALRRIYPRDADVMATSSSFEDTVATELFEVRKAKAELATKENALKATLQSAIGDASGIHTMAGKFMWKSSRPTQKTDWKALCAQLLKDVPTQTRETLITEFSTTAPGPRKFECPKESK